MSTHVRSYNYFVPIIVLCSLFPPQNLPCVLLVLIDFELKKVLISPLGNFADISYLKENFKPHILRDVCTLCSGALVSDSL